MRFLSTKNTLGKIKNVLSTLALGFLVVGTAQAEIIDFQAEANNCNADLSWTTGSLEDVVSFDVQKSFDGINFVDVTNIRATTAATYAYSVRQNEDRVVYRIIENHRLTFPTASTNRIVKTTCNVGSIDSPAIGFYPNPLLTSIGGDLHITLENEGASMLNIQITDITGRVILQQNSELHRGFNQIDMNVAELSVGSYIIVTSADGSAAKASRFVVQK